MSAPVNGVYPRQRSADSDNASQGAGQPDAKRLKSLDTQRAFRARKAAHVKDLEVKVALQDIELARLRRENDALRMQVEALQKKTSSSIAMEPNSKTAGCCTKKDPKQAITEPLSNEMGHSNARLQHSQSRSQPMVRVADLSQYIQRYLLTRIIRPSPLHLYFSTGKKQHQLWSITVQPTAHPPFPWCPSA